MDTIPLCQAKNRLSKLRATPIYVFDSVNNTLIYISDSKTWLSKNIGIHLVSLENCLSTSKLYLDRFLFSLDYITELPNEEILSSVEFKLLVEETKNKYSPVQPERIF